MFKLSAMEQTAVCSIDSESWHDRFEVDRQPTTVDQYQNMMPPSIDYSLSFKHKTITSKKFEQETLSRFDDYEKRRKDKLLMQKKMKMMSQIDQCAINRPSSIVKPSIVNRSSLISRLDAIIDSKRSTAAVVGRSPMVRHDKDAAECTFRPIINKRYHAVMQFSESKCGRLVRMAAKKADQTDGEEYGTAKQ